VAAYSRLNIGYRHILPALPFLFLMIGVAIPDIWRQKIGRWGLVAGMAWVVVAAFLQHPHQLAYFNELIGGSAQGYRFVGDSNLDWGQDLQGLAEYAASAGDDLSISYYGTGDPAYYKLAHSSLAVSAGSGDPGFHPANPAPGRYAISAAHWQGLLPEADLFDWFRRQKPVDHIGYSILIYEVDEAQPGKWIAQCLTPGPLLPGDEAENLVGLTSPRHLIFDCETSWVFPGDGQPGWYILPIREEGWWFEGWPYAKPVPVYRHRANEFGPAYEVYYWPGETTPTKLSRSTQTDPILTGAADLWDYTNSDGEWLTLWRVTTPTTEPLSVQAHLYDDDADPSPIVADGLGFANEQWQPGDWFIQRHIFGTSGNVMETGLYNYLTLEAAGPKARLPAR
jgi:hypothetical protein